MSERRAVITGIDTFLPEYRLTNDELSKMVDTSDEWIMQRVGIKERRIFREQGKATSDMATEAVLRLLKKTNTSPEEIDFVIVATITPDMPFPAVSNLVCDKAGLKNAWGYDINAACSGFIFSLTTADAFIKSGKYNKIIVIGSDMMSSITNYNDRTTCPLFGDAAAAVLVESTSEDFGIIDHINQVDGSGVKFLHMKAGGSLRPPSHETVENHEHFVYQEGKSVFKVAVSNMADVAMEILKRNHMDYHDVAYLVPHQANMRIIEAVANRMGFAKEKVMVNIEKYGNTTAATIPLCLWEWEKKLKKGDYLVLVAFGGGFTWGSILLKWAYDS